MIELLKLISVPRFPDDDDGDGDGDDVVSFTNPLAAGSEAGNLSSDDDDDDDANGDDNDVPEFPDYFEADFQDFRMMPRSAALRKLNDLIKRARLARV